MINLLIPGTLGGTVASLAQQSQHPVNPIILPLLYLTNVHCILYLTHHQLSVSTGRVLAGPCVCVWAGSRTEEAV